MAALGSRTPPRAQQMAGELHASTAMAVHQPSALVRQRAPIDGGQVLDYCEALLRRYTRMPATARAAAVLWAAHAHARDAEGVMVWDASPRLMFLSSDPGSGKSRALELVGLLSPCFFGLDTEPSEAGVVYTLGRERATLCLDEGDLLFGAGKRKSAIRAVLNSGTYRSGTVLRMRGGKGERANVFGPTALAGLDVMKTATGEALNALFSRSIVIRMHKSAEPVPSLDRQAREVAALIQRALAAWTASVRDDLAAAKPELPEWLANRPADIWAPLLAIGEAAGPQWAARAQEAAEELARYADTEDLDEEQDVMGDIGALLSTWED